MNRLIIVHRWEGSPSNDWYPWLSNSFVNKDWDVVIPAMPNPDSPIIEDWVSHLGRSVGIPDNDTYFVGHSIGCQAILRYLETIPETVKVGGVILVAGWISLTKEALPDEKSNKIAKPWLKNNLNWESVKEKSNNFAYLLSDDDPFVPMENANIFKDKLGAAIITQSGFGHYTDEEGVKKIDILEQQLLEQAQ